MQIQELMDLYKPPGRKNFLSYPYILFKFSELLELDELLTYFPMLKPTKLMEQDVIWAKFCKHLKWNFILPHSYIFISKLFLHSQLLVK